MEHFKYIAAVSLVCFTRIYCLEDCDIHATITRRIENEGFHRELHSLVEIVVDHADMWSNCSLILEEKMPAALYVNPDQLQELQRFGQLPHCATVMGTVNIELPEAAATGHTVIVHSPLRRAQNLLLAKLSLPVHVRYRAPVPGGGLVEEHLGPPRLLLHCSEDTCLRANAKDSVSYPCEPCQGELSGSCVWHAVHYKTNSVVMSIYTPVGNSDLRSIVAAVTLTVTWTSAAYILSTLLFSQKNDQENS